MKFVIIFSVVLTSGLVGCVQFEKNRHSDEFSTDISSLSKDQEEQVSEFAASGQLNATEEKEMDESISGSSM